MTKEQKHYNLGFDAGIEVSLSKMREILLALRANPEVNAAIDYIDEQLADLED